MHASYAGRPVRTDDVVIENGVRNPDHVLKEINAHGVSILRVTRGGDGKWAVRDDANARRITGRTPMEISGPVRGSDLVKTKYSPDGVRVRGTLNNCAHGVTPWNTYMTAEENWASYFRNGAQVDGKPSLPREHARYGVRADRSRYGWELASSRDDEFVRFDATPTGADATQDYRNEPNAFGWMVEIDPFNPKAAPIKRTALGRFAHEGVVFAPASEGKPVVCYSGDDAQFEYIYKFVSARPYQAATASGALLDEGVLYVARFNDDGSGEWLPLVFGQGPLTIENGFRSQADVLVNTRLAADRVGATKMDRPEWGAVDPRTGDVYFTLTNNARRTRRTATRRIPARRMPSATSSAGRNRMATTPRRNSSGASSCSPAIRQTAVTPQEKLSRLPPLMRAGRSLVRRGRSSVDTDGHGRKRNVSRTPAAIWQQPDARSRSCDWRGPPLPCRPRRPGGYGRCYDTGWTHDVHQHPASGRNHERRGFAAGKLASNWPDGPGKPPRSATVVITRDDNGVIGA